MNKLFILIYFCVIIIISGCRSVADIVKDYDGNEYKTVIIGNQVWMGENLKTTHYQNGDTIHNIQGNAEWRNATTPAYCSYNNDTTNIKTYGLLYNWYVVADNRNVCPSGWHVPDEADWSKLELKLGGSKVAGGKLKERGTEHWKSPNEGATNETQFTALPSGIRHMDGGFFLLYENACFWSSTKNNEKTAWYRDLDNDDKNLGKLNNFINSGFSIRCVKNW